jgi:N-alpha-acetyltransferase 50
MTLGCLAPYRRLGIGTRMVEHVMDIVEQDGNFDSVFLHVQVKEGSTTGPVLYKLIR